MIIAGFDVGTLCYYIYCIFQSRKYFPRIGTDFDFLGFFESRDVNHWYGVIHTRAGIIQAAWVGYIQFVILHTDIVRVSSCCNNGFYFQWSSINSGYCSVKRAYVCLVFIESYRTGLARTAVITQHLYLTDWFSGRKVYYFYGTWYIDYDIYFIAIDSHVIGGIP